MEKKITKKTKLLIAAAIVVVIAGGRCGEKWKVRH